jgi:3-methyladenine DNA glycosylase Tag
MRPTIAIYNVETDETTIREMNDAEYEEALAEQKVIDARLKLEAKENAARELARKSALEKLAALGLTEAEIQALAG